MAPAMKGKPKKQRDEVRDPRNNTREPRGPRAANTVSNPSSRIYGVLPVLEALRAGNRRVDKVLIAEGSREKRVAEIIAACRQNSIAWARVPRETIAAQLGREAHHQGVMALTASVAYADVDDVIDNARDPALFVILDGVEDPRNLGAILRTAECAGADGVIIPERRAVGLTETVSKASAGAVEFIPVAKAQNLNRVIENLKERNIWVVGTSTDAPRSYTGWDWTRPTALVLGGEGTGLHRLVSENCDVLVNVPMYGKIDSLNVSVAAGVILFEARRQRS